MTTPQRAVLHLDSGALQVLAHPLRSQLLTALRMGGPATATDLARTLDTNTGATSYHLRKLASVGLVEEVEGGRGRERRWQAATVAHEWTEGDVAEDPDGQAATDWLRRNHLQFFLEHYQAWLDDLATWPLDWQDAASASDYALRLSPARLAAFDADVQALVAEYRKAPADDRPGTPTDEEIVQIYLYAFPFAAGRR